MNPVLEAAILREAELRQELEKVKDFINTFRYFAKLSENTDGNAARTSRERGVQNDPHIDPQEREAETPDAAPPKRVRVSDNPKPELVVAAAVELIRAVGRPMTRREIREQLAARGVVVNGADPVKALGTMLWRSGSDQLEQIEGRGYWPKGDLLPEVIVDETAKALLRSASAP